MRALRQLLWACPFLACTAPPLEQEAGSGEADTTGQYLTQQASGLYRQGEADSAVVLMQAVLEYPPEVAGAKVKSAAASSMRKARSRRREVSNGWKGRRRMALGVGMPGHR